MIENEIVNSKKWIKNVHQIIMLILIYLVSKLWTVITTFKLYQIFNYIIIYIYIHVYIRVTL